MQVPCQQHPGPSRLPRTPVAEAGGWSLFQRGGADGRRSVDAKDGTNTGSFGLRVECVWVVDQRRQIEPEPKRQILVGQNRHGRQ